MKYSKETHPLLDTFEIGYWNAICEIRLSSAARDTLVALTELGPLEDGCVPSKRGRNELFCLKVLGYLPVVCSAVIKGEQGYQVATYVGSDLYKAIYLEDPASSTIAEATAMRLAKRAIINAS